MGKCLMGICRHGYMSHGYMSPNHSKPTILQPFQIIWENIKIYGEFKTDQDRLKSDRHGGHGKAKECQR